MFYDFYYGFAGSYLHGMLAALLLIYLTYKGWKQGEMAEAYTEQALKRAEWFAATLDDVTEVHAIRRRELLVYASSATAALCGLIFALPSLPLPSFIYPVMAVLAFVISAATQQVLQHTALRTRCYTGT